jgi:phage terminase large subunit-like protein
MLNCAGKFLKALNPSELLSFPAGKHDDQVDTLGLVGQPLDTILPGQHPAEA